MQNGVVFIDSREGAMRESGDVILSGAKIYAELGEALAGKVPSRASETTIFKPGGIRVGTPAVTTRGMKEEEMLEISDLIAEALQNRTDEAVLNRVRDKVRDLTRRFPLPS